MASHPTARCNGEQFPLFVDDPSRFQRITGNASDKAKKGVIAMARICMRDGNGFGDGIGGRLDIVSADLLRNECESEKLVGKAVCEIDVKEDMLNGVEIVHGACLAYLIDICTTLSIEVLVLSVDRHGSPNVSQNMDVIYHSPACLGDRLRIVAKTTSVGARTLTARCEVWNVNRHRIVASGVQTKMQPLQPPSKL